MWVNIDADSQGLEQRTVARGFHAYPKELISENLLRLEYLSALTHNIRILAPLEISPLHRILTCDRAHDNLTPCR